LDPRVTFLAFLGTQQRVLVLDSRSRGAAMLEENLRHVHE
jgi:hypothetical protein